MHPVQRVNRRSVQMHKPRPGCVQVHPPGMRGRQGQPGRQRVGHQRAGQAGGGGVFGDVVGVQPRGHHLGQARRAQPGQIGVGQGAALAQASVGQGDGMGQDRARCLIQGNRAKAHYCRRIWVIWAMTLTAISPGVLAPMSRPTGAWIRAISSGVKPAAARRSTRLAWVFFDPRQPR